MKIYWHNLEHCSYIDSMKLQAEAVNRVLVDRHIEFLFYEYPPTITYGVRCKDIEDQTASDKFVKIKSERGGLVSLHNPGQLVCYPILPLKELSLSPRSYVCFLEKTLKAVCQDFGIESIIKENNPGLFTERGKIASIGLRITQGISSHGFSLNVSNNLSDFDFILPCGSAQPMDRIHSWTQKVGLNEAILGIQSKFSSELKKSF